MTSPGASVVHLSMRKGKEVLSVGSGVLYRRNDRYYIATAWHNLTGRNSTHLNTLSPTGGVPDNVVAMVEQFVKSNTNKGSFRRPFTIQLETDENTAYFVHPVGWPKVDVAVIPINGDTTYDSEMSLSDGSETTMPANMLSKGTNGGADTYIQAIQDCVGTFARLGVSSDLLIDPGDDLFVLGYPRGLVDFSYEPIWKRATVASNPHIGWKRQAQFLIDCASREGMSGAPVIAYSKTGTVRVGGMTQIGAGPSAALHGIYVGRIFDPEVKAADRLFEAQIGTVWKRSVIDEIIDGEVYGLHSSEVIASDAELKNAVSSVWPTLENYYQRVLDLDTYRWAMVHAALKKLNGNADPNTAMASVMQYANELALKSKAESKPKD